MLREMGWEVHGPDLTPEFFRLSFQEQIDAVFGHFLGAVGHAQGPLVGKSYGAYILLHANLKLLNYSGGRRIRYPNTMLLFAPIVGCGIWMRSPRGMAMSRPPRADTLASSASRGHYPSPDRIIMHLGEEDESMDTARQFAHSTRTTIVTVSGKGHDLGADYERRVLAQTLGPPTVDRWGGTP